MKQLYTLLFLLFTLGLFAQPVNDDCSGIVDLGIAPSCDSTLYNNVGATESNIGFDNFPGCFTGNPERDVWFSFVASDTILDYRIELTGCPDPALGFETIINPQIAVYRGDCEFDGLQLLDCFSADAGETTAIVDLIGLTPGITYFIRINDWSPSAEPNSGAFKLCVIEKPPINTIDQGGSNECSGTLTDSGGPDGDYENGENFVYTICPSQPNNCINFGMQYYNLEAFGGDQIIFYDGPDTGSPVIATLDGFGSGDGASNGGVCYEVSASSGCLTVQFISDGTVSFEGFLGTWQCTTDACQPNDLVSVDASATPEEIVQSVVAGQTVITVTDINCADGSVATFEAGDNTDLGLSQGLVLTTGQASQIANPGSFFASTGNGFLGDPDLDYLSTINGNGITSQDACVVEMEVFAATDELTFEYVFGSEEYPEFVNTSFNDIFAFLVKGPGIVGDPNIDDQLNIATLPNGTFIQINSVNDASNWQFYRDNTTGQSVVYDGLTSDSLGVKKSLTARVNTIPCNTYKLKFAIADRGDSAYDSGVFISEIKGGSPDLDVNYFSGIDYLVEDCVSIPDEIQIALNNEISGPVTFDVVVTGTAEPGVDYTLTIPSQITFNSADDVFTFPVMALSDLITEGIETIEIQLIRDFGCGAVVLANLIIEIHDNLAVEIFDNEIDTTIICITDSCTQLNASGAAEYFWQPPGIFSDPGISNPIVCTDSSQWVKVTGSLGVCTDTDSIFLNVLDVQVDIQPGDIVNACQGDTVILEAVNSVNNSNLLWTSFFVVIDDPTDPVQQVIAPPFFNTIVYNVQVDSGGCFATDQVTVNFTNFDFPQVANDTVICENYSIDLGEDIESNTTIYQWTPELYLDPGADVSGPVATPEETITYTLVASSGAGICSDTAMVTIEVIPADVEIINPDTTYICLGDSVTLNSINSTGGAGVTWSPSFFLDEISPEQAIAYPPQTTWYYSTLETANCLVIDSVLVYVDSLPDLSIMADPAKESYCQGEEVLLVSPTYEPANFPGIELMWEPPMPGAQTPDSFLNLVILALETNTFVRTTTVNACKSVDSIHIEVVPVASIEIVPMIDTICQGESVTFSIEAPPEITEFTWMPPQGLSCTECPDPTASPPVTTNYQVEAEFEGCPVGASATIVVTPGPQYSFPNPPFVCPGGQILLNSFNDPNATYQWTSSDGSLTTSDPQPVVSPTTTTTYFLVASRGDCMVEDQVTIEVPSDFNLSVEPVGTICFGTSATLNAGADQPNITFTWTDENNNEVGTGPSIQVSPSVTTTYTVTASDPANCFTNVEVVTVDVTLDFNIVATADPETVLAGETSTLSVEADIAGIDFEWFSEGVSIGTGPVVSVSSCETQTYNVIGTDFNGCTREAAVTVTVLEGFTINDVTITVVSGMDSLFEGQEFYISVVTTPPVIPGATYEYFIDTALVATTNDTTSGILNAQEILENIDLVTANVTVVITSIDGCTDEGNEDLIVYNNPVAIPNVFTPNGDNVNEFFNLVSLVPVNVVEFRVWDRWGKLVYDNETPDIGWDGFYTDKQEPAASDVYVYRIVYEIDGGSGQQYTEKGDVTLLR